MRNTGILLILLTLSSCVIERTIVDSDDMYVWRSQRSPAASYRFRDYSGPIMPQPEYFYFRPFTRPMWYGYNYWNQSPTVIIVPRQENNLQPGKRPDRGSLPNHNNQITPRRGRN